MFYSIKSHSMMLAAISVILAAFSIVQAQDISNLPPCSFTCILDGVESTICSSTDYSCICRALPAFQDSMLACLSTACSATDLAATSTVLQGICTNAGVIVVLPSSSVSGVSTATAAVNPSRTGPMILANPTTTLATLTITPLPTHTVQPTVTILPPTQASSTSQSSDLSAAAKVGLGLGIPLAVALLGGLGWLFYRLHRKKKLHLLNLGRIDHSQAASGPVRRLTGSSASSVDGHRLQDATAFSGYPGGLDKRYKEYPIATIELPATQH